MGKVKFDLTGQRFGKLLVIKRGEIVIQKNGSRMTTWTCKCDCGNIKDISSNSLRQGVTKSCGICVRRFDDNDLVGKTFGRLTVIKHHGTSKHGQSLWLCSCTCGNTDVIKSLLEITKLKYPNCGCYKKKQKEKVNWFEFKDDYCIFYIKGVSTFIDKEDYEIVNKHTWHIGWRGYILSNINNKRVQLHRILMNAPKELVVDHIDGNILNNRKENLRIVTISENARNRKNKSKNSSSKYFGVSWDKNKKRWHAVIRPGEKTIFLGVFKDEIDAALAYNVAAEKYGYLTRNIIDGYTEKPNVL